MKHRIYTKQQPPHLMNQFCTTAKKFIISKSI